MNSLLRSIAYRWREDATLCALIPFNRFFTGRVPGTQLVPRPYASVLSSGGGWAIRTDKTKYPRPFVSVHIWVDDDKLEDGLSIAKAVEDAYAEHCWELGDGDLVIDVLSGGEPLIHQVEMPTVKAWEVVQTFTFCLCRQRADANECCIEGSSTSVWDGQLDPSSSSSSGQ